MRFTLSVALAALIAAPVSAQDAAPAAAEAAEATPETTAEAASEAAAPAEPADEAAAAASPAAPEKMAGMFDPPPADKGQIVFYRPGGAGGMVGCMVREGEGEAEKALSKLTGNRYFVHVAEPGAHEYWVKSEATDKLNLEIEPGETYFVKCKISMGIMVGRPNLSPSDLPEFQKYQAKLKLMVPKDEGKDEVEETKALS